MNKSATQSTDKTNLIYVGLIFIVWLITYIICQLIFKQKLGWDEVAYLSVARGIAEDFDFSARSYTIMGLLKQDYPSHLINYPIFSIYLAVFLKLFGIHLKVAYFANWLASLGICILIYFMFLMISEKSYRIAFVASLSYLFAPGMLRNIDSAMMEQAGCFLLALSSFLILRDYYKGVFNYFTALKLSLCFLILWLFKTLFIGFFVGSFIFIFLVYKRKIPFFLFVSITYGVFVILFYIVKKFVFYPLSPMMTFSPIQETRQIYADFLGGYLNNFPEYPLKAITYFFTNILGAYFIYPAPFMNYPGDLLNTPGNFIFLGVYMFLLFVMIALTFACWKKLSSIQRIFVCFTLGTIVSFNSIFNLLLMSYHSNIWRYNMYYLPIYICCLALLLKVNYSYIEPFVLEHLCVSKFLLSLFLIFGYFPLFLTLVVHYTYLHEWYHNTAKNNAEIVESFIKGHSPKFIYITSGTHTSYTTYPVKQIFRDATNEQLLKVNEILPEPIEFLFLKPNDWLFKNNQEAILNEGPILDGKYKLFGYNNQAQVVVYKYDKGS